MRRGEDGERVVSVSIPIQHVQAVLGVLTLEASDVDAIIARERAALIPFILIAIARDAGLLAAAEPADRPAGAAAGAGRRPGAAGRGPGPSRCPTSPSATTSWAT